MLLLASLALAASTPSSTAHPVGPLVQARATVQIISGVRLKLDGQANPDAPSPRDTMVETNGEQTPAKLIEFE